MRLLVVPDPAPAYDDAIAASGPVQALAVPAATHSNATDRDKAERVVLPGAARQLAGWSRHFAQALAEALAGSRPADQLRPWTTEQTRRRIRQLGGTLSTGQRPRVHKIMTSVPSPDALEMTAIVHFGPRTRVLAFRLERADTRRGAPRRYDGLAGPPGPARQRWLCTAIESA